MEVNLSNFPGDVTTNKSDLLTEKLIFNSVVLTKNSKFMYVDIGNFCLKDPMKRYEYMKLPLHIILYDIIQKYNPRNLSHKCFVYTEIKKEGV